MPGINLNALKAFDTAARHLNFTNAAKEMHVTQAAVAQQVRQLEADISCTLFNRKARGLELTEKGQIYHMAIQQALQQIVQATGELTGISSSVHISVPPSFATKWLVPKLGDFESRHPGIDLQINASEKIADFKTDGIDMAVRLAAPPFAPELDAVLFSRLSLCAVCSPAYAHDLRKIKSLADFIPHRLLQDSHRHWENLFDHAGLEMPARTMTFNQTALAMDAAASDRGIALVPKIFLNQDISQGRLKILWEHKQPVPAAFYVVSPKKPSPKSELVRRVRNWLLG